ncbi:MAG TPA: drug/metabolite exporter YedA [Acidimicrobiia bacterium]|nr:drug/metabolite exporter YedA [Acidimicrobiia bacterium]
METSVAPLSTGSPARGKVIFALIAVYFIWGSTYLGLRFALEGFPPFLLNGIRFMVAGGIMFVVLRSRGETSPTPRQWRNLVLMGIPLFVGGLSLVTTAEDLGVGSGVVATAIALTPVWAALWSGLFGQWPVRREWMGLIVGLLGVLVLAQEGDFRSSALGTLLVVIAPISWAFGSIWGPRLDLPKGLMAPAAQLLSGGVVLTVIGLARGQRIVGMPSTSAWLAMAYLIFFGSIIAYTSYFYLIRTVRPTLATSYAYVNPIVAVALGLTLGGEVITGPIFIALPLILLSVGLVATAQRDAHPGKTRPLPNAPATIEEAA